MSLTNKLLASAALCGAFIGCGPDVAEVSNPDSQTKGSVQFILTDSETGSLLDSVSIERFVDGTNKIIFSDSTGEASVKSLGNGEYRFLLSKEGYASVWQTATLGIENDDSDAPMIYDEVFPMSLYELGAEVKGKVYYTDKDGNKQLAEGAKVELSISSSFVVRLFTATTDENGEYTFSDLPENITYSIKVLKFTDADDVLYNSAYQNVAGIKAGDTENADPLFVSLDAKSFTMLNSNIHEISVNDTIVVSFSEAINTSEVGKDDIRVNYSGAVATNIEYSSDKKTVKIAPVSGSWRLNSAHYIYVNVESDEGASYSYSSSFTVKSKGELGDVNFYEFIAQGVDTNSANADYSFAYLYFGKLANADGYEIYRKDYDDSSFVLYTSINDNGDDTLSYYTSFNDLLDEGRKVQYMIVGYNGENRSSYATAPVVTIEDDQEAEVTTEYLPVTTSGLDRTGISDASFNYDIYFDDSMDMDLVAGISFSGTSDLLVVTQEWESSNRLGITITHEAGVDASSAAGDIDIDLSTLKDEAGNSVKSTDDSYTITVTP